MKSWLNLLATIIVIGAGALSSGCHASAGTYVETQSAAVYDTSPTLIEVEPGVWIVSRQQTAVYYADNTYWTCRGNRWYRSSEWNGAWVSVDVNIVPVTIVHRDSTRYVYRTPPQGVATRPLPPGHRDVPGVRRGQVEVDHRARHNEMGSTWSNNVPPGHHKHDKRNHDRGR